MSSKLWPVLVKPRPVWAATTLIFLVCLVLADVGQWLTGIDATRLIAGAVLYMVIESRLRRE